MSQESVNHYTIESLKINTTCKMYFQVKKKKTQNKSLIALWHCLYSCLLESAKSFTQTFICWDLSFLCSCYTHFHSSLCKISQELSVFIHCTESVSQGQKEKEENSDGLIEMNKEKMSTEGKWKRIRPTRENCGKENAEEEIVTVWMNSLWKAALTNRDTHTLMVKRKCILFMGLYKRT